MVKKRIRWAAPILAAAALSACSSFASQSSVAMGTVQGKLVISAGLSMAEPVAGSVSFSRMGTSPSIVTVKVGNSGVFRVRLNPGSWHVSGSSPKFESGEHGCSASTLILSSSETLTVSVICIGK